MIRYVSKGEDHDLVRSPPCTWFRRPSFGWFDIPNDGGLVMNLFKITGIAETISTMALFFFAVPMKYLGDDDLFVRVIGPVHGALFTGYIFLLWWGLRKDRWKMDVAIKGALLAVVPGGPIYFDKKIINGS